MKLSFDKVNALINTALKEDGAFDDVTSRYCVDCNRRCEGHIILKQDATICGLEIARAVFKRLDKNIILKSFYKDGERLKKNTIRRKSAFSRRPLMP